MEQSIQQPSTTDLLLTAYSKKGTLTINDFCAWASIGRSKFYQQVKDGTLTTRKIGGKTVVTMPDAMAWLNSLPEAA